MIERLAEYYRKYWLSRPGYTALVFLVLVVLAIAGMPRFHLDASADSLLLDGDPDLEYYREMAQRYRIKDSLVVLYRPEQELGSATVLKQLQVLSRELQGIQGIKSVFSIINAPLLYSPKVDIAKLQTETKTIMSEGTDPQLALTEFQTSPIYRDTLVGPDGRTTGLLLNLDVDNDYLETIGKRDQLRRLQRQQAISSEQRQQLEVLNEQVTAQRENNKHRLWQTISAVREAVKPFQHQAVIYIGGATLVGYEMMEFIRSDIKHFSIMVILLVVLVLIYVFRHWQLVLLPMLSCSICIASMIGILGWLGWSVTVISSNFISMLFILCLVICIHIQVRYRELVADCPNLSREQLVVETFKKMLMPCWYSAVTTIIAFSSLVISRIQPVIDFGWMMSIGTLLSFLVCFSVVLTGLLLLPPLPLNYQRYQRRLNLSPLSRWVQNAPLSIGVIGILLTAFALYGMSQLQVENRFVDFFKEDTEMVRSIVAIDKNLGGTMPFDILIDAPSIDSQEPVLTDSDEDYDDLFDQEDEAEDEGLISYWWSRSGLEEIEKLHDFLESQQEIGKVLSLATGYKLAKDLVATDLNDVTLAVLRRELGDTLSQHLLTPYLNEAQKQTRLSMRIRESTQGLSHQEMLVRIKNYALNEMQLQPEQLHFTGLLQMYNNLLVSLYQSQILTLGAVFIGILIAVLLLLRSLRVALIAILPNMIAALVVLGIMGLFGISLDFMTITIAAITIGIGIDYSIHYIYRFRQELERLKGDYLEAMHCTHKSIGHSISYTAITISVGFLILVFSQFKPSIYFGVLISIAMLTSLVGVLTLLPMLLLQSKPFNSRV